MLRIMNYAHKLQTLGQTTTIIPQSKLGYTAVLCKSFHFSAKVLLFPSLHMRCHKQNFRDIRNEVSSLRGKICSLDSRVNNIIQKIEKHSLNYSSSSSLKGIVFVPFLYLQLVLLQCYVLLSVRQALHRM